jgi:hypothetical protein
MSVEVVTYANKSQGMFEELVNNEFGVPVKVLGWGTKWNGFSDKYKAMSKHLETKNDDDIVIFLDGFDTKINKNPHEVVELFKECDCGVLVSKDPMPFGPFSKIIFGTCDENNTANSGLYMGYVKYLKIVINQANEMDCEDDQRNLNDLCKVHNFIKIDEQEKIFKNVPPTHKDKKNNAVFVSYPGTLNAHRIKRSIIEYTQFLYMYILCLLILGLALFPQRQKVLLPTLVLFTTFYAFVADKSCTLHSS